MRLSICIPAHDGRAAKLQRALDSILDQVDIDLHGVVEVCVSDNASEDGTAVLVAERQRERPKLLRYHAFSHTEGFAPNLLQAVALASGEFCWLFSSDDLMAPGGLRRVLRLLERNPDATGATVGLHPFDFEALRPGPPFSGPPCERTSIPPPSPPISASAGKLWLMTPLLLKRSVAWFWPFHDFWSRSFPMLLLPPPGSSDDGRAGSKSARRLALRHDPGRGRWRSELAWPVAGIHCFSAWPMRWRRRPTSGRAEWGSRRTGKLRSQNSGRNE